MFCKRCGSILSMTSTDRLCPVCRKKEKYAQPTDDGFDYIEQFCIKDHEVKHKQQTDKAKVMANNAGSFCEFQEFNSYGK
ncbi:MAG: hypothetical protein ACI4W6_04500 [Acutalibacteraceae bacterium]